MTTKNRKRASNVLLLISLCIAGLLWSYGAHMANEAREQSHRSQAWREIVDHSPSAVIVANTDGVIVQWSAGAETLLGWSKNEAEGADLQLVMPPDRYERHQAGFYDPARRAQLDGGGVLQVNGYVMNSAGEIINVDVRITAVTNGELFYVATLTRAEEVIEDPEPAPPPPQMQYAPPDIQEFRS